MVGRGKGKGKGKAFKSKKKQAGDVISPKSKKKQIGDVISPKSKKKQAGDGIAPPPPKVPRTIENSCVLDETVHLSGDKELMCDKSQDEFASYFQQNSTPKVLLTSSKRPSMKSHLLMRELQKCIPNSLVLWRKTFELKKLIPQAEARGYTDILVVNEDRKAPNGLQIIHLPEGPTAHFKLTSFKRGYDIKGRGRATSHKPEVILNHFNTALGTTVGRMFASLFPYQPQFIGRQVVTFHNQRDYIFFRHHRYIFKSAKRVGMQELGPRFTLKLRSLQKGTFNSQYGEYYWLNKKDKTETGKKKFHL